MTHFDDEDDYCQSAMTVAFADRSKNKLASFKKI